LERAELDGRFKPDGYNVGINVGAPAGQTVKHCHIHLIPRRSGDSVNPRGRARRDRGQGGLRDRRTRKWIEIQLFEMSALIFESSTASMIDVSLRAIGAYDFEATGTDSKDPIPQAHLFRRSMLYEG